jgi:hypothetical protein
MKEFFGRIFLILIILHLFLYFILYKINKLIYFSKKLNWQISNSEESFIHENNYFQLPLDKFYHTFFINFLL